MQSHYNVLIRFHLVPLHLHSNHPSVPHPPQLPCTQMCISRSSLLSSTAPFTSFTSHLTSICHLIFFSTTSLCQWHRPAVSHLNVVTFSSLHLSPPLFFSIFVPPSLSVSFRNSSFHHSATSTCHAFPISVSSCYDNVALGLIHLSIVLSISTAHSSFFFILFFSL